MDLCFVPIQPERFNCRRNPFMDKMMRRYCENSFSSLDEEFAFPSEYHHPFFVRSHSFLIPRRLFLRKEEEKDTLSKNHSENTTQKNQIGHETRRTSKTNRESDEKSLQMRENICKNLFNIGEVFPSFDKLQSSGEEGPFQVNVNLHGCDPDKIKVEIKDGVLKVEGRKETSDGSYTFVRHEQTIPKSVSTCSLKASLHPEGVLTIRHEEDNLSIPVTMKTDEKVEDPKENAETEASTSKE